MDDLREAALWARKKANEALDARTMWLLEGRGIRPSLIAALEDKAEYFNLLADAATKVASRG